MEADDTKEPNEKFIRFQSKQQEMHTFFINLLLTLSIAILGFLLSGAKYIEFNYFTILCFGFSILCGVIASFSRLCDFRKTTKITKIKRDKVKSYGCRCTYREEELKKLRYCAKSLGHITWGLTYVLFASFLLGVLSIIFSVVN